MKTSIGAPWEGKAEVGHSAMGKKKLELSRGKWRPGAQHGGFDARLWI